MGLLSTLATAAVKRVAPKLVQRISGRGAVAAGVALGSVAAGTAVGNLVSQGYEDMGPVRRRRKGLSGRDIQGAQRVMQLVSSFGYKPKLPCRRKGRKCGR